ncbi:T9SS type A sorting domain-containing protein [Flavobacterium chungnamense]|uniref:Peptidase A1 domain-containing protein n=1 Tax=Flavobacterium chungnamense TaxID=706182 RepID=A0ABP7UXR4_9FLAO
MKKITLLFVLLLSAISTEIYAQTDYLPVGAGNSSTQVRGPQGTNRYHRSVWILTAAEMTAAGFTTGNTINALGFNFINGLDIATTGNIQIYLQNSTDTANTKGTAWTSVITGMTSTYNGSVTLPTASGDFYMPLSTNFNYTGGSLYVAFDYQNAAGNLATVPSTIPANTAVASGTRTATSATAAPTTLGAFSTFRPQTILGKLVDCARPLDVAVPSTTLNSANITFTSSNPVNIQYGAYDFDPATTGTYANGVSSPYTLNGLQPSTAYEIYTKSDCGGFLGTSANTVPVSFHTTFQPATPSYNTSFEIDNHPNIGWVADEEPNGTDWFMVYGGTGSALVQNGLYSCVSLGSATAQASGIMYSRGINLQASGNPVTITFQASNYQATGATNTSTFTITAGTSQTAAAQTIAVGTGTATTSAFALKTFTFTPPTTGVYYIGVRNTSPINGVANSTHALIIDNFTVSQTLANNEVLESKFSTYPNPAKNVINVANTTDALISGIEITDINGRVVKNQQFSNVAEVQVTVSDLAQGMYTMKIVSDKGIVTKKVIKE